MRTYAYVTALLASMAIGVSGCGNEPAATECANHHDDNGHNHSDADHRHDQDSGSASTERIDIPPSVRQNLGITFIKAELRRVEQTLRAPGRFERLPTARREYRTMLPGRVELLAEQFQKVELDAPLYRIESPAWRDLQQQLSDAEAAIERHTVRLASLGPLRAAHRNHEQHLGRTIDIRRERVAQLERVAEAGGGRAAELSAARDAIASGEAELAEVLEKEAELAADEAETRSELAAAISKRDFLLDTASAIAQLPVAELLANTDSPRGQRPRWRTIDSILVRAEDAGVVESIGLTNGAWADEKSAVLTVVQPDRLRFRAVGLQSDLGRLRDGLRARIVAPAPTRAPDAIDLAESMSGALTLGVTGDPDERTIDLFVTPESLASWARAGISAQLEIVTDQTSAPAVAIPKGAVQRDGIVPVFFLRDPYVPDVAMRIEADLGLDDGRWIVVSSGLSEGEEDVLDGAFQLMLATATGGGQPQGGHFHSDGTFHAGDDH